MNTSTLPDRIRSLPIDPGVREVLAELAELVEHSAEFERMLTRARAGLPGPPRSRPVHLKRIK
jgi:hypothetical protein